MSMRQSTKIRNFALTAAVVAASVSSVAAATRKVTDRHGNLVTVASKEQIAPLTKDDGKLKTISHFLHIDASQSFQELDHAGAAITESSAIIIMEYMTKAQRAAFLQEVFAPTEAGTQKPKPHLTIVRLTMGASDFNVNYYSYDDIPADVSTKTDFDLKYFSTAKDEQYLVPLLQEIKAVNPKVKILGTPWSAPGWMKDTGSIYGGTFLGEPCKATRKAAGGLLHAEQPPAKKGHGLDDSFGCNVLNAFANYFVKFVEDYYVKYGLAIDALALQNEALNSNLGMPSMILPSAVEGPLGVAVRKGLIGLANKYKNDPSFVVPRLFAYDHNWDNVTYPEDVLQTAGQDPSQPQPMTPFEGAAFHCYNGNVENQTNFQNMYKNADIWMTECSGGGWAPIWQDNLHWEAANLYLGNIANFGKTSIKWNLILTPDGGPRTGGGCTNCRGVFTFDKATGKITPNEDWFPLQNFATSIGLSKMSGNGGTVNRIDATIDSRPYPTQVVGTVNAPSPSSPTSSKATWISLLLNINLSWCSSGAIHIPFFYSITLPGSKKVCKPLASDGSGRTEQMNILCPSVSSTVFALTDPNENWIMVQLDQSYITRNQNMTGLRYDSTDLMPDWQARSNWTCL